MYNIVLNKNLFYRICKVLYMSEYDVLVLDHIDISGLEKICLIWN